MKYDVTITRTIVYETITLYAKDIDEAYVKAYERFDKEESMSIESDNCVVDIEANGDEA